MQPIERILKLELKKAGLVKVVKIIDARGMKRIIKKFANTDSQFNNLNSLNDKSEDQDSGKSSGISEISENSELSESPPNITPANIEQNFRFSPTPEEAREVVNH